MNSIYYSMSQMAVWILGCVMNSKITTLPGNLKNYSDSFINECDKSARNNYVVSSKSTEHTMSETTYSQVESEKKGFQVILEFPDKSDNETVIHEEVKQILANLLQEQIVKIS